MKKYSVILVTISLFVFISCNNTLLPVRIPAKDPKIPENNIIKEIPRYEDSKDKVFVFYKYTKQKQKQLKLTVPENGFDSLMVRVWFVYPSSLFQYGELLELNLKKDAEPIAKYTKLDIFFNPTRDYENINSHKDTLIKAPLEGWNKFINKMDSLNITQLPTIEFIPEYIQRNQGQARDYGNNFMTVAVEIATPEKYRFIQYNNFFKYKDIKEVNQMYLFIQYLREQFDMGEIDKGWFGEM